MSNDSKQVDLERKFKQNDYLYIRKNQTRRSAESDWKGIKPKEVVKKEDLAQYIGATQLGDPARIRTTGKKSLFKEEYYNKIFKDNDFEWYVLHMYLGKFIEGVVRDNIKDIATNHNKKTQWWDARWVVMNIFWNRNNKLLSDKNSRNKIIDAFKDKDTRFRKSLSKILKKLFNYSNKAYHENKKYMTGDRKSRNDFFGLKDCKEWTEQMINDIELKSLENKMEKELDDFWNKRKVA